MSGEKTEKATPKKLKDLRKKGTVAKSAELPSAVVLVVAVVMLPAAIGRLNESLSASMSMALSSPTADLSVAVATAGSMVSGAAKALAPILLAMLFVSLLSAGLLSRSMPNPWALKARKERLSPKSGVKRLFSAQILFELSRSSIKLGLLAAVSWGVWRTGYAELLAGPGTVEALVSVVGSSLGQLLLRAAALALVIGIIDAKWSRRRFDKQAKMSVQDVKEEGKQAEGNPQMKGEIRARAAKLSRGRMLAAIAGADVVLANPTHLVVALTYKEGTGAPVVVARAAGSAAERIKAEAATHDVPVVHDKPLARALYRATEVGDPIPIELYHAVAEILATVYASRRSAA